MWESVVRLVAGLQPEPDALPLDHWRWCRRVGLTLAGVSVMSTALSVAVAASYGLLGAVFPGFLKSQDLSQATTKIQQQVANVQQEVAQSTSDDKRRWAIQLANAIPDVRYKHCHAKTEEGKRLYWGQITTMMDTYQDLTGRAYNLPACQDL